MYRTQEPGTAKGNKFLILGIVFAILATVLAIAIPKLVEDVKSGEIVVIQSVTGELKVVTEPGPTWQWFGTVTRYPRRNEFTFGSKESPPLKVRFYDGGQAELGGSISWMMPADPKSVIAIHRDFRSPEAFELQAIRRSMESASTFSGPTMTAFDSAAGRRNELLQILNDQTTDGVYKTITKKVIAKDLAGIEKEMTAIEIVKDSNGQPVRAQTSYVNQYNVQMLPMTISAISYEDRVEKQIKEQQDAVNAAVVAKANAAKAEQDAITIEAQGRAAAMKTKWQQEEINAKSVAQAEAAVKIANASVQEAEAYKKAQILRGEGEARAKELVMAADGALEKKLAAYNQAIGQMADAIRNAAPGAWSPTVVMGQQPGGQQGNAAITMMEMMSAKFARDLSLDLGVPKGTKK
jgi:hypothetical protein